MPDTMTSTFLNIIYTVYCIEDQNDNAVLWLNNYTKMCQSRKAKHCQCNNSILCANNNDTPCSHVIIMHCVFKNKQTCP